MPLAGSPVILLPQKPTFLNSNSIWKQWMKSHSVDMPLQIPNYLILNITYNYIYFNYYFTGLIDIPALNQQEQDQVRRPVRYGTKKPKKQQQQQQQQQQDQEETEKTEGSTEDLSKKNCVNFVV